MRVNLKQGTKDWLKWRQSGIGASEIYALALAAESLDYKVRCPRDLGDAPPWIETPVQLYRRKTGAVPPPEVNEDMARGSRLEPLIRTAFCARLRIPVVPVCVEVPKTPLKASLDGWREPHPKKHNFGVLVEIKAPRNRWDAPPEHAIVQVAYQAAVARAGLDVRKDVPIRACILAGFEDRKVGDYRPVEDEDFPSFDLFKVQEDRELGAWLTGLACHFWKNFVQKGIEPPLTERDTLLREDEEWAEAARAWRAASAVLENAEAAAKEARERLIALAGDFVGAVEGSGVRVTRVQRAGSVDYRKALAELAPDADLEPFRKSPTETVMVKAVD